jgi:hypothetical protein
MNITITLHQAGDKPTVRTVGSLQEASAALVEFQDSLGMGASDMGKSHGLVHVDGRNTHRVSYNGKVWTK